MNTVEDIYLAQLGPEEHSEIQEIIYFYYCFLVAIKIAGRYKDFRNEKQKRNFIYRWIESARKKRVFPKCVADDLSWLKREFKAGRDGDELELLAVNAYNLFNKVLLNDAERKMRTSP